MARLDQLARLGVMWPRALLRARLHDAFVPARDVDHPAPFAHEERERLFDIHVLARGAGHHGVQRVPMIGRRDDHRIDIAVLEELAEVGIAAGLGPMTAMASSRRPLCVSAMATRVTSLSA